MRCQKWTSAATSVMPLALTSWILFDMKHAMKHDMGHGMKHDMRHDMKHDMKRTGLVQLYSCTPPVQLLYSCCTAVQGLYSCCTATWSLHGCQTCTSADDTSVMPLALASCVLKSHGWQTFVVGMDVKRVQALVLLQCLLH